MGPSEILSKTCFIYVMFFAHGWVISFIWLEGPAGKRKGKKGQLGLWYKQLPKNKNVPFFMNNTYDLHSTEMQSISGEIESVKVTMTLVGESVKVRRKDLDLWLGDRRPLTWRSAKVAPFHHVDIHVCISGRCLGAYSCFNMLTNRLKVTERLKWRQAKVTAFFCQNVDMWPSSALNILSALNIVFLLVTNVKTVATYDSSTKYLEVSKVEPFLCCCHVDIHWFVLFDSWIANYFHFLAGWVVNVKKWWKKGKR